VSIFFQLTLVIIVMAGLITNLLYALFAEAVWIVVGALVGVSGSLLGLFAAMLCYRIHMDGIGRLVVVLAFVCGSIVATLSGLVAAIQLLFLVSFETRLKVMLYLNGVAFAVMFVYTFLQGKPSN